MTTQAIVIVGDNEARYKAKTEKMASAATFLIIAFFLPMRIDDSKVRLFPQLVYLQIDSWRSF